MKDFSFIHVSDLHLDSPFKGVTAQLPSVADALRSATFKAYDNLINLCIKHSVKFLVIAGDVYDGADRSIRAQLKFLDGLTELANHGISAYIAHGNHDPFDGWSSSIEWPVNAHIFSPNEVSYHTVEFGEVPIAIVSGISYKQRNETRNLAEKFDSIRPDLFQIGVLHCNCGKNPSYDDYSPCLLEDLTRAGLDYWALGHVHERKVLCSKPFVVYSGNTQGRSILETGARGCYLVRVNDKSSVELQFCALNAITWMTKSISINTIETVDGLDRVISRTIEECRAEAGGCGVVCRIELTGRGPLYGELNRPNAVVELLERGQHNGLDGEPFVWLQNLEMNCSPEIDLEKRCQLGDFLGEVLEEARRYRERYPERGKSGSQRAVEHFLKPALGELYNNSRVEKVLEPLSKESFLKVVHQAELLCLDLLDRDV